MKVLRANQLSIIILLAFCAAAIGASYVFGIYTEAAVEVSEWSMGSPVYSNGDYEWSGGGPWSVQ